MNICYLIEHYAFWYDHQDIVDWAKEKTSNNSIYLLSNTNTLSDSSDSSGLDDDSITIKQLNKSKK